jgi:transposase
MRAELMTGPVRRRRWTDEDKLRILREAFAPGAVVADVARRHDVRGPQIYQWRSAFLAGSRRSDAGTGFVAVAPALYSDSGGTSELDQRQCEEVGQIELVLLGGRVLRIRATASRDELQRLIRAVEAA